MADRAFRKTCQTLEIDLTFLSLSFAPAGTGAPTGITGRGVASIVRNSAGNFTITLEDAYSALLDAKMTIAMDAATDISPQLGAVDVVTAKTIVVRTIVAAVETDIAANANNRVYVELSLRNSALA